MATTQQKREKPIFARMTENEVEKFAEKVDYDVPGNCWLWQGNVRDGQYGALYVGSRADDSRSYLSAHRIALTLSLGREIEPGHMALHACGNKQCVNPEHLYEGTATDNIHDYMRETGRLTGGQPIKLSSEDKSAIRAMGATGRFLAVDIAPLFDVTPERINQILRAGAPNGID